MGSFNFKSSGVTKATQVTNTNTLAPTPLPIGILTPLALGDTDLLKTSMVVADQMTDNLKNLILTNWGERLCFYNYGANLQPLMTNLVSQDDFDSSAINNIRAAVKQWMPYVDLVDFISKPDRSQNRHTACIQLTITYNIPNLNVKDKKLQVTLYAL